MIRVFRIWPMLGSLSSSSVIFCLPSFWQLTPWALYHAVWERQHESRISERLIQAMCVVCPGALVCFCIILGILSTCRRAPRSVRLPAWGRCPEYLPYFWHPAVAAKLAQCKQLTPFPSVAQVLTCFVFSVLSTDVCSCPGVV